MAEHQFAEHHVRVVLLRRRRHVDEPVPQKHHTSELRIVGRACVRLDDPRELVRERAELLDREGALHRDPLIEPVALYQTVGTLAQACRELNLSPEFSEFAACGAFAGRDLYIHQRAAVEAVCSEKRSMVVTTGTGSGKTECFVLPVIEALVRESSRWTGRDRQRAVRALILYPLNALVEDQMSRLRRSLDGPAARAWLAANRAAF